MPKHFTEADGHRLAAAMLREIKEHVAARWERECAAHGGADYEDDAAWRGDDSAILLRYLATVGKDSALAQGFFAALTEFIGSNLNDVDIGAEFFAESASEPLP